MKRHRFWIEPVIWAGIFGGIAAAVFLPDWLQDGSGMRFDAPMLLLGLAAAPLVLIAGIWERRTGGRMKFSLATVAAASGSGLRVKIIPATMGIRVVALCLLVVAMARPQDSNQRQSTEMDGIDIVVTVDVSGSMKAADLEPTRLEAAKEVVKDFISRRKNDRIGSVIFATNAYTLCPLTLDYSILTTMIDELDLGVVDGSATAIGNAVGMSINRLRKSDAKSKVIILLTDGTSNAGNISPEQAATFAETLGIKIYAILVGQRDEAAVAKGMDFFKNTLFGNQASPINPELLRQMSEQTGGAFFEATDKGALVSSFHSILDALERSRIEDMGVVYAEAFQRYLWTALILIALDLLVTMVVIRRTP